MATQVLTAAAPLDASDNSYYTFPGGSDGATISYTLSDTEVRFVTADAVTINVEYSVDTVPTDDVIALRVRIVNGATILAAADAAGTFFEFDSNITSTTDITSGNLLFDGTGGTYINTTAAKADWDGASIEFEQGYNKNAGPDGVAARIDFATATVDYLPALLGTVSASDAYTDTASGSGSVPVAGTVSASDAYTDTGTGTGEVPIAGSAATSDVSNDTSGITGAIAVVGSGSASDVSNDTSGITGAISIVGSASATGAYTDTASGSGSTPIAGSSSISDSYTDTASIAGDLPVAGTLSATDAYNDTSAISGGPIAVGTLSATDAYTDTLVGLGDAMPDGPLAATDNYTDTASISGTLPIVASSVAATDAYTDTLAGSGTTPVSGSGTVSDSYINTASGSGTVDIIGAAAATETVVDISFIAGYQTQKELYINAPAGYLGVYYNNPANGQSIYVNIA